MKRNKLPFAVEYLLGSVPWRTACSHINLKLVKEKKKKEKVMTYFKTIVDWKCR